MAQESQKSSSKAPFRSHTVRKLLELAEAFELDELSLGGIYIKRGGPAKSAKVTGKAAKGKAEDSENLPADMIDWTIEDHKKADQKTISALDRALQGG